MSTPTASPTPETTAGAEKPTVRKWLVAHHRDHHGLFGEFATITAETADIEHGCAVFRTHGELVDSRAAGVWTSVCPDTDQV